MPKKFRQLDFPLHTLVLLIYISFISSQVIREQYYPRIRCNDLKPSEKCPKRIVFVYTNGCDWFICNDPFYRGNVNSFFQKCSRKETIKRKSICNRVREQFNENWSRAYEDRGASVPPIPP